MDRAKQRVMQECLHAKACGVFMTAAVLRELYELYELEKDASTRNWNIERHPSIEDGEEDNI